MHYQGKYNSQPLNHSKIRRHRRSSKRPKAGEHYPGLAAKSKPASKL